MTEKGRLTDGTPYSVPRMGDFLSRVLAFYKSFTPVLVEKFTDRK
jgi:hypothetical protein